MHKLSANLLVLAISRRSTPYQSKVSPISKVWPSMASLYYWCQVNANGTSRKTLGINMVCEIFGCEKLLKVRICGVLLSCHAPFHFSFQMKALEQKRVQIVYGGHLKSPFSPFKMSLTPHRRKPPKPEPPQQKHNVTN